MLTELQVRDLGVIASLRLVLPRGMTALTGETGAGKTMLVEAIELLVGGRADSVLVRPGAAEAWVEGRFEVDGDEVVLARAIPASGRSRAYVDGRLAPVSALAEAGAGLVDLHGQHAHQSLLSPAVQRAALDAFAGVDLAPLVEARGRVRAIGQALAGLGGDGRARAREVDLLRFQLQEIEAAMVDDADEEAALEAEEERLADVVAHRESAAAAHAALTGEGGATDTVGAAIAAISGRPPFQEIDARHLADELEDDPERLAQVRARRQLLRGLRRKYGDTLADVIAFAAATRARLDELEGYEVRAAELERQLAGAEREVTAAARAVAEARRDAAPRLAAAVAGRLRDLAMPRVRFEVVVGDTDPGDEVSFLLGANPGEPALPLVKVASGGELARTMLAARLVLTASPPTLVFDEVDAGIGGEAALAVGRALSALAGARQVLVVTHLPQVAAFADHQVGVRKREEDGRTVADAAFLQPAERVVELSRMLSGQPESEAARDHAEELLAAAARERGR